MLKLEKRLSQQVFVGHCFQTHSGSREQILFFYFSKPCISMLWKFTSENAILRGRIRTSLFPSGSRMGPQGATKGTKRKMRGSGKTLATFHWNLWSRIRTSLFPSGSRMKSQGATKGTKRKMSGRWENPGDFLLDFMRSYQDLTLSIMIRDGTPRDANVTNRKMSGRWKNPSDFL